MTKSRIQLSEALLLPLDSRRGRNQKTMPKLKFLEEERKQLQVVKDDKR